MANTALRRTRLIAWSLVGVLAVAATGLYAYSTMMRPTPVFETFGSGDYRLQTAAGEEFTRDTLTGHPSLLFFGFTHCPDVCPTTLAEITGWYDTLGNDARDLKAYLVTIDPERDTAPVIGQYVSWTDGKVTGVTGTPEGVAKMAKAWGAFFEKVGEGDDYTMNHTASVFLLNRDGNFEGTIAYQEPANTAIEKLRRLVKG